MSEKYDEYLQLHKANVYKAFCWLKDNLPEIFNYDLNFISKCDYQCMYEHDKSKTELDEYKAYDRYFYGGNKSYEVVQNFNIAWLKHIHRNEHHWQHWVLINDNPNEGEIILDMPDIYIIEMICDWWAFSFSKDDLNEIFNWYDQKREYIKLSDYTRMKVEDILNKIHIKLNGSYKYDNKI